MTHGNQLTKGMVKWGYCRRWVRLHAISLTEKSTNGLWKTIGEGLKKNQIVEIDGSPMEKAVGWTSLEKPYFPDFDGSSFVMGTTFVFSMRIDKKAIPAKVIDKHYHNQLAKKMKESGRDYLSRNEKKMIKEHVKSALLLKMPATPKVYDLIWNYEKRFLWFFSTLKSANEELETLFSKSFQMTLIRLFPFTLADLGLNLTDGERDRLLGLSRNKMGR